MQPQCIFPEFKSFRQLQVKLERIPAELLPAYDEKPDSSVEENGVVLYPTNSRKELFFDYNPSPESVEIKFEIEDDDPQEELLGPLIKFPLENLDEVDIKPPASFFDELSHRSSVDADHESISFSSVKNNSTENRSHTLEIQNLKPEQRNEKLCHLFPIQNPKQQRQKKKQVKSRAIVTDTTSSEDEPLASVIKKPDLPNSIPNGIHPVEPKTTKSILKTLLNNRPQKKSTEQVQTKCTETKGVIYFSSSEDESITSCVETSAITTIGSSSSEDEPLSVLFEKTVLPNSIHAGCHVTPKSKASTPKLKASTPKPKASTPKTKAATPKTKASKSTSSASSLQAIIAKKSKRKNKKQGKNEKGETKKGNLSTSKTVRANNTGPHFVNIQPKPVNNTSVILLPCKNCIFRGNANSSQIPQIMSAKNQLPEPVLYGSSKVQVTETDADTGAKNLQSNSSLPLPSKRPLEETGKKKKKKKNRLTPSDINGIFRAQEQNAVALNQVSSAINSLADTQRTHADAILQLAASFHELSNTMRDCLVNFTASYRG